jgi:glutathione S-transferase
MQSPLPAQHQRMHGAQIFRLLLHLQSAAITRYIAQHTDFYPADPWQRALADEAMALTEDVTNTLRPAFLTKVREL